MKNPFGDQQIPGSPHNLEERVYQKASANVNEQVFEIMRQAYEHALTEENPVLSRTERKRLFSKILKFVFEDLSRKLDVGSSSA